MSDKKYLDYNGTQTLVSKMKGYVDTKVSDVKLDYSTTSTVDVGGVKKGTSVSGSIQEILDAILSPYVATSNINIYVRNASDASVSYSSLEYGTTLNIAKLKVSWTEGSTQVKSVKAYKGYLTSLDNCTDDKLIGSATVESGTSATVDIEDQSVTSSISFTVVVTDGGSTEKSIIKNASFGTWYYPYYAGTCTVTADQLTAELIQSNKKSLGTPNSVSFTTNDSYPFIAVTSPIKKVTDSSGVTDYTNAFGTPTEIDLSSTDPTWGPKKYYVYTGSRGTLNDFTFKFSY